MNYNFNYRPFLIAFFMIGLTHTPVFCSVLPDSLSITDLILQFEREKADIENSTNNNLERIQKELSAVRQQLRSIIVVDSSGRAIQLLLKKERLEEDVETADNEAQIKRSKLRYKKGIELIRLLYEKILGLDHHFFSSQTTNDLLKLSNPHNYPEFVQAEIVLKNKIQKQTGVELPRVLEDNPVAASSFLLAGTLFSEDNVKQKEKDLVSVACILDFTLRMSDDLNLIFMKPNT